MTPVILCGGSGTRLWPRSRATKPKPFLPLIGKETLFEQTLARCSDPDRFDSPIIVTGRAHLEHVEAQLRNGPDASVIVEPAARNSAAAIALAAQRLPQETVMLICPSDHYIGDPAAFGAAAEAAATLAADGWLVCLGIEAKSPETGFGYLKRGEPIDDKGFRVAQFVEKPDLASAKGFLAEGGYAWNGGIFAWRADDFLRELAKHRPALADAVREATAHGRDEGSRFHPHPESFARIHSESVDYAVMENTAHAAMVPADMAWSDIGTWQSLHQARPRDENGNCVSGRAELVDCKNVLVDTDAPRVSVIGLKDVVVVVDGGEILVASASGAQMVGQFAAR